MNIADGINMEDNSIRSFLMIGQSNMAGRGDFGEVEEIKNPNCFMLRMGRFQRMSEPINPDRAVFGTPYHSGVGLAASFADELEKHTKKRIGLIPCADGGTVIAQWMPGQILYDHALLQCRLAMRSSVLSGILWHQGESDCMREDGVCSYSDKLVYMMSKLREDLGTPELPIVMGEISESISEVWNVADRPKAMNRSIEEAANRLPLCAVAKAADLQLKTDGIHFDSRSCRILGKRYFDEYIKLTQKDK